MFRGVTSQYGKTWTALRLKIGMLHCELISYRPSPNVLAGILVILQPVSIFHGIGHYTIKVTFRKAVPVISVEIHISVNRLPFFSTKSLKLSVHMHFKIFLLLGGGSLLHKKR
jgi:hypothetical protein